MMKRSRSRNLALCWVMVLGTACSASVSVGGSDEVSQADIEKQVAVQLATQQNQPEPKITCPGPLKAELGATLDCTLLAQGETAVYPVHVVVTATDDGAGELEFTAKVGEEPIA